MASMHWYTETGESLHTIVGANGKERDTTLRDAKKLGLVPSVSTIKNLGEGYYLVKWKLEMLMSVVMDNRQKLDESADVYEERLWFLFNNQRTQASDRGSEIHHKLDEFFKTGNMNKKDEKILSSVISLLVDKFPLADWASEKSFADNAYGFGGCVDLHSRGKEPTIIDFKTKDKNKLDDKMQYEDHKIQLAAYQVGLELPENTRRFNLFISTHKDSEGLCHLVECKDFVKHWTIFQCMLKLWHVRNNIELPTGLRDGV